MTDHTTRRSGLLATALLVVALPLAPAGAQDRDLDRELPAGKVFRGEVGEDGAPAQFLLTLKGGQALELTAAQVGGSDPYLRVLDAASGELIAENDDSAGSLAARTRLYSAEDRRVRIEVTSAAVDEAPGAVRFDLILNPSNYRPRPPRNVALGETLTGTLEGDDEQLFRFRAERGQLWTFTMSPAEGSDLDPVLEIFAGDAPAGEVLASDDDGGGGLNARVRFLVPRTGSYVVRASGVSPSAGAYLLAAGSSQAAEAAPRLIELGRAATGTLDGDTPEQIYRLGEPARAALTGSPGPLVIELRHIGDGEDALDPVLELGFETPLGFSSVLNDDDGGGDTDARLVFDASTLGPVWLDSLRIKASAFNETSGDYELRVSTAEAD